MRIELKLIFNSYHLHKVFYSLDHYFSAKPFSTGRYENYYEKVTTYINLITPHASAIDSSLTAKTFQVIESSDTESVFNYWDTNSSRAEIDSISEKLKNLKIAIIGVGGTGSYVLDFVAKTPVKEIHIFDGDEFLSHNAFRAPGAASIDALRNRSKKVTYLHGIYSNVHKNIIPHPYQLKLSNIEELACINFVFLCIDDGETKGLIIKKLIEFAIPFVDTGVGVLAIDGALTGCIRLTTVTKDKEDHFNSRIPFADDDRNDYEKNVQIAELNALNASLAIIKWKKLFGFYHDLENEYHTVYSINSNKIVNEEKINS